MQKQLVQFMLPLALLAACTTQQIQGRLPAANRNESPSTRSLTQENYYSYVQTDNSHKYGYWVKFSANLSANGTLKEVIFQNTRLFPLHADFLTTTPEFKGLNKNQINDLTVFKKNRKAFVGALFLKHSEGGSFIGHFEIVSEDPLEIKDVGAIQKLIAPATKGLVGELGYLPTPNQRTKALAESSGYQAAGIKLIIPTGEEQSVCYSAGWGIGRVLTLTRKDFEEKAKAGLITPEDLVIVDEIPRDVVPVAGLISESESSPSSHVALLGQMLGFPVVYQPKARKLFEKYAGKVAFFRAIGETGYCSTLLLDDMDEKTLERLTYLKKPVLSRQPALDEKYKNIINVAALSFGDVARVGGKAANLSRLVKLLPEGKVPKGVAIPVHYFKRYLREAKTSDGQNLQSYITSRTQLFSNPATPLSEVLRAAKEIRDTMKSTPVPTNLVSEIENRLRQEFPNTKKRLKLRSSSNVEDLREFNGAGLYDSTGICLEDTGNSGPTSNCRTSDKPDPLAGGLNKVWRSLYSDRGVLARRWYGIDENVVAMGILVNPTSDGELANGVAIFEKHDYGLRLTITGFPGEDLEVVHPPVGKVPESTVVETSYGGGLDVKTIVKSTELPAGRTLLTPSQYKELFNYAKTVYEKWGSKVPPALDFEWKLISSPSESVYLKQVREVPEKIQRRLNNQDHIYILPRKMALLESHFGERHFGLLALQARINAHFDATLFTSKEFETNSVGIKGLRLETLDGDVEVRGRDLKYASRTTPWAKDPYGNDQNVEVRERSLKIYIPNPYLKSLALQTTIREERGPDARQDSEPVIILGEQGWKFSAEAKELLQKNDSDSEEPGEKNVMWTAQDELLRPHTITDSPYDQSPTYQGEKITFKVKATTTCRGFCKTMFLDIEKVQIAGLLDKSITITNPRAFIYAPAHHNFSWEYAVDLFKADGLTESDVAKLQAKGGRFLTLTAQMQAEDGMAHFSLWSETGKKTLIDKCPPHPPGAPPPGGGGG